MTLEELLQEWTEKHIVIGNLTKCELDAVLELMYEAEQLGYERGIMTNPNIPNL